MFSCLSGDKNVIPERKKENTYYFFRCLLAIFTDSFSVQWEENGRKLGGSWFEMLGISGAISFTMSCYAGSLVYELGRHAILLKAH